jgi:hypothetical protein
LSGLNDDDLAQQHASALPPREQMSLLTTGSLGSGLVDTSTTADQGDMLGGTDAAGSTDPDGQATGGADYGPATGYVNDAEQEQNELSQTPTQNDGTYDPNQTATSTSE